MTILDEKEPGVSLKLIVGLLSAVTVVVFSGILYFGGTHQSAVQPAPPTVETGNM